MKTVVVKALRWLTTVVALILSLDALLSIYKTIAFRGGMDSQADFFAVLLVCLALLMVTTLTGLGALAGSLKRRFVMSGRAIFSIAIGIGLVFLLINAFPLSEWIRLAVGSKSESVAVCVVLCCVLAWLTWEEKEL